MKQHLVLFLLPVLLLAIGPDQGGYRWVDSDESGGPAFNWIDISGSGTLITLADDDNQGPFALGLAFDFYGRQRDSVRVCSNGWVSFSSESHQFHHHPIPDARDPNSLIAALWADLDPSQGGSVYYLQDSAHERFIVSWVDVPLRGTTDSCTFQVVMDTSGDIVLQYLRLPEAAWLGVDSCSVGIENDSGTVGLEYLHNGLPVENQLHDSLAIRFYRLHLDVYPSAVLRPMQQVLAEDSVVPLVVVRNTGLDTATFPTLLKIGSGYCETLAVTDMAPLSDKVLQFPAWVPAADTYALELVTALGGDEFTANDTLRTEVVSAYSGEIRYDDGDRDTWFFKNGSPTNEWAGAVKFSVPYGRFRLLGARLFVDDATPFGRVVVCPDSSGEPQWSSPYLVAESVAAGQPESWLEVPADTQVVSEEDVWLLAFWQARATGPRIGEDRSVPVDNRSYFGSPTVRWFTYTTGDVMARLVVDGRTGISEVRPVELPRLTVSPNPFSRKAVLCLKGSLPFQPSLVVRDVTGRRVRALRLTDAGEAVWDGRDHYGRRLPAGVYFIEARSARERAAVQVLLTR
ncbi:hypothetical protein JXD38_12160 [candidate division WOR-3 bacterium]|nr:hypothetical protein [candidate division WOR-3 bacterium]